MSLNCGSLDPALPPPTLEAEAQSGTFTTYTASYIPQGFYGERIIGALGDLDSFITKTDTFTAGSKAIAVFGGILFCSDLTSVKMRLFMNGVQVADSAYLGIVPTQITLLGDRSLSGSMIVKVNCHNYTGTTTHLKWFSVDETTLLMHPFLAVGSVKI